MSLCSSITATCGSNGFMLYHYVPMWCNESIYYAYLMTPSFRGIFFEENLPSLLNKWWFIPIHYIVMSLRNRWLRSNENTNSHLELYC